MASKIKKITVENFKAISKMTANFNGCTALIIGANNKGKSSFLRGFTDRMRGQKPATPVKIGEEEGYVQIELTTGEKFIWQVTNKTKAGEKLTFISERDIKGSLTKDLCQHYFPPIFDVDKFLAQQPAAQRKTLQKLTGIEFDEIDQQIKGLEEERKYANRKYDEAKAKQEFVDPTLPKEETPTESLEAEISNIDVFNLKVDQVLKGMTEKRHQVEEYAKDLVELETKMASIREKQDTLKAELEKGQEWLDKPTNQKKDNKQALVDKLAEIRTANEEVRKNKDNIKHEAEVEKLRKFAEEADKAVKAKIAEKDDVIKSASMPDGFGFSDEGITYKGYDFTKEQLSSSGLYIAALKLAAITLGEVKTLHFDASFLDRNNLQEIQEWAEANDLQLLIERPDFDGGEIRYEILEP